LQQQLVPAQQKREKRIIDVVVYCITATDKFLHHFVPENEVLVLWLCLFEKVKS
jgi:hypothetical protein